MVTLGPADTIASFMVVLVEEFLVWFEMAERRREADILMVLSIAGGETTGLASYWRYMCVTREWRQLRA